MKVRTSLGFWVQQCWGFPKTVMRRLAVPRLPPGAIPENRVLDLVKREVGMFTYFTWSRSVRSWEDCNRRMTVEMW